MAKIKTQVKVQVQVQDVAAYILDNLVAMTAMKLQKLAYYSQAWSLVWDEKSLFEEEIQAWANGPVSPELYRLHKGQFVVTKVQKGTIKNLTTNQKNTIDKVLNFYGDKTPYYLSRLTHTEDPWKNARKGVSLGAPSTNVITDAAMLKYYKSS